MILLKAFNQKLFHDDFLILYLVDSVIGFYQIKVLLILVVLPRAFFFLLSLYNPSNLYFDGFFMTPFSFSLDATDGYARAGTITTPHGTIHTPIFMPVGTRSAVK